MSERIPYIGYGNDTLDRQPKLRIGDEITCPRCSQKHRVEGCREDGRETELLLFYICKGKEFLAGVAGRSVLGIKSDVSGQI